MPGSQLLKQKYIYCDACFTSAVNCVNPSAGVTEAQASVMRRRRSCNFGGEVLVNANRVRFPYATNRLVRKRKSTKSGCPLKRKVPLASTLTDLEICQAACKQDEAIKVDDSDGDECVERNPPTNAEMRKALDILKRGVQHRSTNFEKQYEYEHTYLTSEQMGSSSYITRMRSDENSRASC
ncbi:hypothetical protein AVEN_91869-1 [Araneus ventricosus]|uniref:Uncharacterized protein n=1 Tax=Araneus ventricosus TaxID=182803 RepID=A0A4Y2G5N7_ARAVE|nr:hypothetical protein AVEN_91869-1 [Araneus ventricosus]